MKIPDQTEMSALFKDDLGTWHYHEPTKQYFRFDKNGVKNGKIFGQFLPDPNLMWAQRIDAYNKMNKDKITSGHPTALAMKCRQETYQLWKHWQVVKDVG